MKNLVYSLILLFIISGCSQKNEDASNNVTLKSQPKSEKATPSNENKEAANAVFEFEETEWDFGEVKEGETVTHVFTFKNVGETPLVIQSARASCGCTVPEWTKDPIPVNETGKVEVSFNTTGRPNVQNKTVTIVANTKPEMTTLRIRAMVIGDADQPMGPVRN